MPPRSKEHHKALKRRWYKRNSKLTRSRTKRDREIRYEIAGSFKERCLKCGMDDVRVLEFHHRVPAEKSFSISEAIRSRYPIKDIIFEIKKCDVLCRNCHAILHAEEGRPEKPRSPDRRYIKSLKAADRHRKNHRKRKISLVTDSDVGFTPGSGSGSPI